MSLNDAFGTTDKDLLDVSDAKAPQSSANLKRFLPAIVIVALLGVGYSMGLHEFFSFKSLAENKAVIDTFVQENFLLAAATYLLIYVVAVSLSFPGASFLTIASGGIFGWFVAGTLTIFGATMGAAIIFLIAKTSIGDYLAEKAGPRMTKLRQGFQEDAFNYLLTLRLAPVVPFWITNLAPALFGMDLFRYVLATFIGIIPGTYAYAFIGQQVGGAVDGSDVTQKVVLGLFTLAAVSVIPLIVKWTRRHKSKPTS